MQLVSVQSPLSGTYDPIYMRVLSSANSASYHEFWHDGTLQLTGTLLLPANPNRVYYAIYSSGSHNLVYGYGTNLTYGQVGLVVGPNLGSLAHWGGPVYTGNIYAYLDGSGLLSSSRGCATEFTQA